MATPKKLPSGSWHVLIYAGKDANGKRKYESITAPTKAEASFLAGQRQIELSHGIEKRKNHADVTVGEAVKQYIDDRQNVMSPKTIKEYRSMAEKHFSGINGVKLSKLTNAQMQREVNREAEKYSPKTIQNVLHLYVPAIHAVLPDLKLDIVTPQKEFHEMKIPTQEQLIALLNEVHGKAVEIPVLLAATCGLRRGEIAALDLHTDVDYEKHTIRINKSLAQNSENKWILKPPKTPGSNRVVHAPDWVCDRMKELIDKKMPSPCCIESGFIRARTKIGMPDIRFHDLRHYYASLLIALGVPQKYIVSRLGHSTPNMLNRVYGHLMQDKDEEVDDTISGFFTKMQNKMQNTESEDSEKSKKQEKTDEKTSK